MARMDQLDKVLLITKKIHVVDCYMTFYRWRRRSCLAWKMQAVPWLRLPKTNPVKSRFSTKNSQIAIPFPSHLEHPQQTWPNKEDCKIFQWWYSILLRSRLTCWWHSSWTRWRKSTPAWLNTSSISARCSFCIIILNYESHYVLTVFFQCDMFQCAVKC